MKINIEIEELLGAQLQNQTVGARIKDIEEKLTRLGIREKAYDQRTEEELADVRRLEELGVKSLFKKVMGNLEKALEKERKEYLSAVLKHKAVEEEIEELEYERRLLKKRYRDPSIYEKELALLVKKKQFLLKSQNAEYTKELFKRESELGRHKLLNQKFKKVLQKAEAAIKITSEIKSKLLEVKDWPPSGKGKYASITKKKYIDKARAKAIQAKVRLEEFGEMTNKLLSEIKLEFELRSFDNFLDRFYDNLITDYLIQKDLGVTLNDIEKILSDVRATTEILNVENEKQFTLILEKEKSIADYTRDYGKKADT